MTSIGSTDVRLARACPVSLLLRHAPLTSFALQLFAFNLAVDEINKNRVRLIAINTQWIYVQLK